MHSISGGNKPKLRGFLGFHGIRLWKGRSSNNILTPFVVMFMKKQEDSVKHLLCDCFFMKRRKLKFLIIHIFWDLDCLKALLMSVIVSGTDKPPTGG